MTDPRRTIWDVLNDHAEAAGRETYRAWARRLLLRAGLALALVALLTPPLRAQQPAGCDPALGRFYHELNRDYFGSRLALACVRYRSGMLAMGMEASATKIEVSGRPYFLINLDEHLQPLTAAKMAVVHEACHVETYGEVKAHGPRWQTCMRYLAVAGAMDEIW